MKMIILGWIVSKCSFENKWFQMNFWVCGGSANVKCLLLVDCKQFGCPYPRYCSDLAPSYYFLFQMVNNSNCSCLSFNVKWSSSIIMLNQFFANKNWKFHGKGEKIAKRHWSKWTKYYRITLFSSMKNMSLNF